ncbi:MAG: signal peptidase I [Lachnospiraceae bacterium]|nr:signal peptidase I [Lachnospiraceae bacterium]
MTGHSTMSTKMKNNKKVNDNPSIPAADNNCSIPAADGSRGPEKGPGLLAYVPAFCSLLGTLILLTVIAAALPLTVPGFMGYKIYNVVSGSMEPAIPVGSIVYVKAIDPTEVNTGDIIAFEGGDSVIMHRVQENKVVEGSFVTKGDANDSEDLAEVPYDRLIGIVVCHIPVLGQILTLFGTSFGRICMFCFAACGALLNILGGRLRDALKYAREEET